MRQVMQETEPMAEAQSVELLVDSSERESFSDRFVPKIVREALDVYRESGFRGITKRYGWKVFAVFFAYYLIRDLILYVMIPYLAYKGFTN